MTFWGKPPLEETPSKTCQRGSRHPIPLKLSTGGEAARRESRCMVLVEVRAGVRVEGG